MITLTHEQAQQVEEALKDGAEFGVWPISKNCEEALATIRAALAEQAEESVLDIDEHGRLVLGFNRNQVPFGSKLYTTPQPRHDVDLTDDEIAVAVGSPLDEVYLADFRAVIASFKEKNK